MTWILEVRSGDALLGDKWITQKSAYLIDLSSGERVKVDKFSKRDLGIKNGITGEFDTITKTVTTIAIKPQGGNDEPPF